MRQTYGRKILVEFLLKAFQWQLNRQQRPLDSECRLTVYLCMMIGQSEKLKILLWLNATPQLFSAD